jgi:hypothetical protein
MSQAFLDIVIPIRNPSAPLDQTIDSLVSQTDRGFAVLLSDNYSTSGSERIEAARRRMEESGIETRLVRPPFELSRVEHWNWAHYSAEASWLKPLFVGDTLAPTFVERLRERVISSPAARLIRCGFEMITPDGTQPSVDPPIDGPRLSPEEFLSHYPAKGNWLGGPINVAYERIAFRSIGGYPTQLPGAADLHLLVTLALRSGIELLPERLAAFHLHDQRFSHGIRGRRVIGSLELWIILMQALNDSRQRGLPWPHAGVRLGTWNQLLVDYWHPLAWRLKSWLGRRRSARDSGF